MNKYYVRIIAIGIACIVLLTIMGQSRRRVKYAGIPCPVCGSHEVLDFGVNNQGEQRAHCYDCKQDFNIGEL